MKYIGFTTKFYTLWDVTVEDKFICDSNGKVWPAGSITHNVYCKNISLDLEKAKEKYPDAIVDLDLKGTKSWDSNWDLYKSIPVELFPNGKYFLTPISEVAKTDFNYVLWYGENNYSRREYIETLPEVVKLRETERLEELKQKELIDSISLIEVGKPVEISIRTNPNGSMCGSFSYEDLGCSESEFDELRDKQFSMGNVNYSDKLSVVVVFNESKRVWGKFPYGMGVVNGKMVKTKGKAFEVTPLKVWTRKGLNFIEQIILI